MRNNPLIASLLAGLVVVLMVAGVSLVAKMKTIKDEHSVELSQKFFLQKDFEEIRAVNSALKKENEDFKEEIDTLTLQLKDLNEELMRTKELNQKLEDSLKEELIKQKLRGR